VAALQNWSQASTAAETASGVGFPTSRPGAVTAAESASNSLMRLTSDRCHVCHLVMQVIGRLRSKENTRPLDHLLGLSDRLLRPDISGTDVARYQFLYELKAGPAGGRLRRPASRRQRHHGHRGTGLTLFAAGAEASAPAHQS
jgi:hypothetical protein